MSTDRTKSIVEIGAIRAPSDHYDVAILGGGLAGLTLAIQLKRNRPDTSVLVLEKREGPAPLAAFKVGESTVPAGAHYFAETVGMRDHLKNEQLVKCGLRFFPPHDGNRDITERLEFGPNAFPPFDTYQVDRGLLENKLAARARTLGVEVAQGARVGEIEIAEGDGDHTVSFEQAGNPGRTTARWVVDASGRASLLKRKFDLATDSGHHVNAAWFRLGGGLDFEQWGADNEAWMARMSETGIRKNSTNHLLGEGYWVWLIPLATGPISIGVCADPRFHPFEEISEFGRLLDWLRAHEPQLAAAVENRLEDVEDFLRVEDFSYGVDHPYSTDRWTLVGEAAAFADPFFSPGSDFICFGNTFTTDLVSRDLAGEDVSERVEYFNALYQRAFANVMSRYQDFYRVFGDPWVLCASLSWDFYANHTGMVILSIKGKLTDIEFMKSIDEDLERLFAINKRMHRFCREWAERDNPARPPSMPPPFGTLIAGLAGLLKPLPDDDALREEIRGEVRLSEAFAVAIFAQAAKQLDEPPPDDRPINAAAISLDPSRWEQDGLFDPPGMTIAQAREISAGIDALWDDSAPRPGPPPGMGPPAGVAGGPPPGMAGGPPAGVTGGPPGA